MRNDINPPPIDPEQPHPHRNGHAEPHTDRLAPGRHPSRFMGDKPRTDVIYAMPMEDRASGFSIGLSIAVLLVFVILACWVIWTITV